MLDAELAVIDGPPQVEPHGPRRESHAPPSPNVRNLNILLVEDDDADAYLIEAALYGHVRVGAIVRARDGVEALDLIDAAAIRPDLAIIDLKMPRKDGFGVLLALRERINVDFPAVVLTSSRAGADALRSRKRGAVMFITKPNRFDKLTAVLGELISSL